MGGLDPEVGAGGAVAEAAPAPAPPPLDPMDPRRFGAMHAILAFVVLFLTQFGIAVVAILVTLIWSAANGADLTDERAMTEAMNRSMIAVVIAASLATAAITLILVRAWAWHLVRDRGPAGLGLFWPRGRTLLVCGALGLVLGGLVLSLTAFVPTVSRGGPLAKMAASGGMGRAMWAVLAVIVAPPIEELLFRGLMLRGMIASWGVTAAGTVVTILFFVLHLFEAGGYWPAMVAILTLSVTTLLVRLRTGSVVAATAVHVAYNAALVVAVYLTGM